MKRALKYGLITFVVLLVGLAGGVWFVAATETGTRLLWRQARAFLPEDAQVRSVDGRLAGPLVVQGVDLRTESMHLALERAELEWSPHALLTGLVHIERLALDGLHITRTGAPPEPEPAEPFELPERVDLPVGLRLDALRLRDFELRAAPGAAPFTVTRAGLAAGLDRDGLVVDRLTLRSPLVDLDGHARVEPRGDYPVEGRLNWRVQPPGYAPADATTRLSGTLRALVLNQEVGPPYNVQAQVSVADVLSEPHFDGELAVSEAALAAIRGDLPPATVSADAGFQGTPADLELGADLRGQVPPYGALSAEIRGGLADQTLTLERLLLERPDTPARARADGVIRLGGTQPDMDVNLQWEALRWPLDGQAMVTSPGGRATASGTPRDLSFRIQAQAQAPEAGAFDLSLDGRVAGPVIELEPLRVTERGGPATLSASGRVTLEDEPAVVDVTAEWQRVRWPLRGEPVVTSPSGSVAVKGSLEDVTARLDAGLGEVGRITGDISRRKQRIDVALDWRALAWPLTGPRVKSPSGSVQLSGTLEDYDLSLDARVDVPEHTGGRVVLEGAGSLEAVELERIDVNTLEGTLAGTARARWSPALDVAVDLRGQGLNPAPVLAGWPGKLGLDIKGRARMEEDGRWRAQLERAEANGVLRGYDVDLDARGGYDGESLSLERLSLASGGTRVSARGEFGESLDVQWRINSDDLGQLLPEAGGRLDGAGTARGPLRRPRVEAELEGEDLRYQGYSAATLDLDASIDAGGEDNSELSLRIENGTAAGVEIARLRLTGSGNARAHSLELAAQTSRGTAELAVTGTVENPWGADAAWVGELSRATLDYPELAPWRLQEAAAGRIDAARASLSRHCWQSGTTRLCLEGERAASGLEARFELDRLDFDYFAALLPRNLRVEGAVSGSGRISRAADGQLAAAVDLRTTRGRIGTVDTGSAGGAADDTAAGEAPAMVAFRESDIRFDLGEQGLRTDVDMRLEQGGVRLQARVPGDGAALVKRPLSGRITTEVPDLSFIVDLIPDLEQIDGRLEGDMELGGSLGAPVLQGEVALIDGTAVLSAPGLTLSDVRIDLIGKGEGGLRLDASAKSGGGTLKVEGHADLSGEAATASIGISGRDFQVFNTAEAQVFASPDLTVNVDRKRIEITGEVTIPRADITPHKIPESAVTVSSDQVIVEPGSEDVADSPGQAVNREIHSKVRVILGDRVRVAGFGLKARFEGDLLVVEKPGEPITGSGEIQIVEGKYKAYGQDLTIEDGRILFPGGPITEPGLDVRAVRRPREDILVGVKVRGNLREPEFTLFSEPPMTQQEQLSYLVLGRSLQESSGAESAAINQAALALGLKSGDFLARNIGKRIGIDEVEVASSTTSSGTRQASLVLGKYLSPDLYISYGIGLLEPVSTVRLQYAISSKWKLVTESSGNQSSGDIIYTIERGK